MLEASRVVDKMAVVEPIDLRDIAQEQVHYIEGLVVHPDVVILSYSLQNLEPLLRFLSIFLIHLVFDQGHHSWDYAKREDG
jgi:hypothetical protein